MSSTYILTLFYVVNSILRINNTITRKVLLVITILNIKLIST